ncbi:cell wall-active antibiotics response protein LiaF [Paenibacillus cymbidii]|uniref:cell wall-active antibiotics response protein LiaF n=1 Tax=Paenibacillus cymbidii TaxID=1639034 RepID=UPI001F414A51|nr:cell wall-active antibiotics response protein LiaF [Paenibacillus cymbidii]
MNSNFRNKWFFGVTLIAVGVVFLLHQNGVITFDMGRLISDFWPVVIIWFGLKGIVVQRRHEARWGASFIWSLFVIMIGVYFLLSNLDVEGFTNGEGYKYLVPVVLIVIGLSMMFRRSKAQAEWRQTPTDRPFDWEPKSNSQGSYYETTGGAATDAGYEEPSRRTEYRGAHDWHQWKRTWKEQWKQQKQMLKQQWREQRRFIHPHERARQFRDMMDEARSKWREEERRRREEAREDWVHAPAAAKPKPAEPEQPKSWEPDWAELERRAAENDGGVANEEAQRELKSAYERRMQELERQLAEQETKTAADEAQQPAAGENAAETVANAAARPGQAETVGGERFAKAGSAGKERRERDSHHHGHHWQWQQGVQHRSSFIGDIHMGKEFWKLEPMNISHFIGDTVIDLTTASIPNGETRIDVSAFIGDVKLFVPNDMQVEVKVSTSAFIGDMKVFDRHEGGLFRNMQMQTPRYADADKKIRVNVSMFIGDVTVKRVG